MTLDWKQSQGKNKRELKFRKVVALLRDGNT